MPRGNVRKEESYEAVVSVAREGEYSNIDLSDSEIAYIETADAFCHAYQRWVEALERRAEDLRKMCTVCSARAGSMHNPRCIWRHRGFTGVAEGHCVPPTVEEIADKGEQSAD